MLRPLRKTRLKGTVYSRRDVVSAEIHALLSIGAVELEAQAAVWTRESPGFISPEALLYFVRNTADVSHRDRLTELLLGRVARIARLTNGGSTASSLTEQNIQSDVVDNFIDLLLADRDGYEEKLDYYEVNFNSAVASDRKDASTRHWKHENRMEALGTEDTEIMDSCLMWKAIRTKILPFLDLPHDLPHLVCQSNVKNKREAQHN